MSSCCRTELLYHDPFPFPWGFEENLILTLPVSPSKTSPTEVSSGLIEQFLELVMMMLALSTQQTVRSISADFALAP